ARPKFPFKKRHHHFGVESLVAAVTKDFNFVHQSVLRINREQNANGPAPTLAYCHRRNHWVRLVDDIRLPVFFDLLRPRRREAQNRGGKNRWPYSHAFSSIVDL